MPIMSQELAYNVVFRRGFLRIATAFFAGEPCPNERLTSRADEVNLSGL